MGIRDLSTRGTPVWRRSTSQEFDVTMQRVDLVWGTITSTRRVFAPSRRAATERALAEARAIWPHEWTITGVHCYTGELGR